MNRRDLNIWSSDNLYEDCDELVKQIQTRMLPRRGVMAQADEILLTLGTQQALYLVASLFGGRRRCAAIEDPGYPDAPTSIKDFYDLKKFPGKRAMRKRPQVNLEWALLADGVAPDKVYEVLATDEGQARAFAKLDTIKKDIVWFDSWSQAPQLLNDGGAVFVQSANGRIFDAIKKDKKPFKMIWDSHIYDLDVWAIVKGTKKKKTALEFISFATGSKPLAGMPDVAYGPTRKSSAAYVDQSVTPDLPTSHLDKGIKADGIFWADYGESLGEKFNEWLLK